MFLDKNRHGGTVIITQDSGAGSSGKGSLNSWIADKVCNFDYATNNWATNAGHYTELDDGTRILVQHIPSAFINKNVALYINAGASLDINTLFKEIETLNNLGYNINDRLCIHPNANVITQANKELEKELIKSGSTFKGVGASAAWKALRQQKLAKDYEELKPYIKDLTTKINENIIKGANVIIEGSQGIDLDLNFGQYPYTTSRQTIPVQLVADAGIPFQAVSNIVLNARANPIRISNESAADGSHCYTGDYWGAKEITWEKVATDAGYTYEEFLEKYQKSIMTSVTKKVRRVFDYPVERMRFICNLVGCNQYDNIVLWSLNFINFIDKNVDGVTNANELRTDKVKNWLIYNMFKVIEPRKLRWIRTGAKHSQIVTFEEQFDWHNYLK